MIATVIITTTLASLAFFLAAHCAEHGLRAVARPTRVPWLIATAAAAAMPLGQLVALSISSPVRTSGATSAQTLPLTKILTTGAVDRISATILADFEYWFAWLWAGTALALCIRLFLSSRALSREARTWKRGEVAGVRAWISQRYGPGHPTAPA